MRRARVTTILPTWRRPALLRRAVLSVLRQSHPDVCVQVLDNASGDDTEAVVAALARDDDRVRYVRHAENLGAIGNIVFGIERVETEFFHVLCDDDVLMPGFIETGLRALDAEPAAAFVSMRVAVARESGSVSAPFPHPAAPCVWRPPQGIRPCLQAGVSLPGVLYRTSVMRQVGPPRVDWWNWTETGWHAMAAAQAPVVFTPETGAVMFDHITGGSKQMPGLDFRISWFRMVADVRDAARRAGHGPGWARGLRRHECLMVLLTALRWTQSPEAQRAALADDLRASAVRAGVPPLVVSAALLTAAIARGVGLAGRINRALDRRAGRGMAAAPAPPPAGGSLDAARVAWTHLSELAGVTPFRAQ